MNITATVGKKVQLWCPGYTRHGNVIWWKEVSGSSERVVFGGVMQRKFEDQMSFLDGSLVINEAKVNDSGLYWCSVGFNVSEIYLSVLGKF